MSFQHNEETYCIKVTDVHEVIASVNVIPLPRVPSPFEGVFQHRGVVFSLLNFNGLIAQLQGVILTESSQSQIVIFAEPYHQFAARIPGILETISVERSEISVAPSGKSSTPILDGIVIREEERYHLVSAMKLFLHAGKLISDAETARRHRFLERE